MKGDTKINQMKKTTKKNLRRLTYEKNQTKMVGRKLTGGDYQLLH